jgi:predicted enzyme related to lactoylglutathione lyase
MPGAPPAPAAWNLYFASDDLQADADKAVKLGATLLNPPMMVGTFGGMTTLLDPTGAVFSFWKAGSHIGFQVTDAPGAVAWHELYSPDAKKARDFYTALLGATADSMPGDLEYYMLKHGDQMLAGIMQIDPAWGNMPPFWVSYFAVANIDDAVATIVKHGGMIQGSIGNTPFGRMASAVDPAGAMFKLLQPSAR